MLSIEEKTQKPPKEKMTQIIYQITKENTNMKHKKIIERYDGSVYELGEDIWGANYDVLVELFDILSKKTKKDSIHDLELNHPQVWEYLANISKALQQILKNDIQPMADLYRWHDEYEKLRKTMIEKYKGSLYELGEDIWDLDYDALVEIFEAITKKIEKDRNHNGGIINPEVLVHSVNISEALHQILKDNIQPMANLCRWYNKKGIK